MILRGEVYNVDLGEPVGHEPAHFRPTIVLSSDVINNGPGALVVVVPVGSKSYGLRSHVELDRTPGGLDRVSYARCDQLRVVSTQRLVDRRGMVSKDQMQQIARAIRFVLDL